jgi:hypothetical protein
MNSKKQAILGSLLGIQVGLSANSEWFFKPQMHTCKRCGKRFKTSYELKDHDWEYHLEERRKEQL